ncbi:sigma-54 dependent transcriptional regulator [Marinobacterium rhizophilum]|nr:sigma-54 dependent transcriptional regulator [Marinobacterium rhizophilum]
MSIDLQATGISATPNESLRRNLRSIVYFCPPQEALPIAAEAEQLYWHIEQIGDITSLCAQLHQHPYHVGLMHVDHLSADEISLLEDLLVTHQSVAWVALTRDAQALPAALCSLIGEHFVDFFHYPVKHMALLDFVLDHANGMSYLRQRRLQQEVTAAYEMVGSSEPMLKLFKSIRRIANVDAPLLITGESGTGKELIARAIHERSERAKGPFVAVNCGALPENLIQSELFGYEKGAFSGAQQRKIGKVETAEGGTLFLDEMGDLPMELQVNLLRFLQESCIDRVGGTTPIPVNVRVISATHVDLAGAIAAGKFREDLYFRLNVLNLHAPPLRERGDDTALLAHYFFNRFNQDAGHRIHGFTRRALACMAQHAWPGNVRELINRVRRAIVMCEGKIITHQDLRLSGHDGSAPMVTLDEARSRIEQDTITHALSAAQNNVSEAARLLGVSRVTLYRLMHKHGLEIQEAG